MKSKEREKKQQERPPLRIRVTTGLAIDYTVGPPHGDNPQIQDGNQVLTEEDIASVITSEECLVLSKMMQDCFLKFRDLYPSSRASAQLIPVNGITDPVSIGGE